MRAPFDPGHLSTAAVGAATAAISMPPLGLTIREPEASSTSPPLSRPLSSLPRPVEVEGVLHRSSSLPVGITQDDGASIHCDRRLRTKHILCA